MMRGKIMNMNVILFAILICELVSTTKSATPSFKDNAADFIEAGFKKTTRRGVEKEDFTKIQIEARPLLMVQDVSSINKNIDFIVEIKSGEGDWKLVTSTPSMRGGVYKWTESNVEPCVDHNVRIWVYGTDESKISFNYPHTITAASLDNIATSGYRPKMPKDLQIGDLYTDKIEVSWTPAKCASLYDVTYQKVTGGKTISKQVQASQGNSIILSEGLDPCSEYEIRVSAVIGDQYSEENIVTFSTPPDTNAAETLDPIIEPSINSVIARWKGFEKLSCVSEYSVSVCKDGEVCSEGQQIERDDSLQFMEFKSDSNLEECSEYTLNIKPVHNEVDVKGKVVKFKTASPAAKSPQFSVKFNQETNKLDIDWSSVQCAAGYKIYQRIENVETRTIWESKNDHKLSVSLDSPEPCVRYSYTVSTMVGSEESKASVWTELAVPPMVGIYKHSALVIEEKTNGSVTFVINNNDKNNRCKVEQYHVKYSTTEDFIDPLTLEDGKITIIVQKENTEIEGRIKYQGFESWSPWISSDSPLKEKQTGEEIGFLLPIIIGSVIALALVILIIFLVVKKKRSQLKYDAEKAEGNTDESKMLNKQTEEKVTNGNK